MNGAMIIAGICAIIAALLQIFARDMAWKSAQAQNRQRGVKSERTKEWEISNVFYGVLVVFGGIFLLWIAGRSNSKQSMPQEYEDIRTQPVPIRPR